MDSNEKQEKPLENEVNKVKPLDEEQGKCLENKLKELHNNVRHITQLGMNWFAFFVTINYLTMGWLAKGSGNESINSRFPVWIIASVFIVQNLLGIVGLIWVLIAANAMKSEVNRLENEKLLSNENNDSQKEKSNCESIPASLYIGIGVTLMLVLISLIAAWVIILCVTALNNS